MISKIPYVAPYHQGERFNCPHCRAFASMLWFSPTDRTARAVPQHSMEDTEVAKCTSCKQFSHWVDFEMVYPLLDIQVEEPNEDLPDQVKADYIEAAMILNKSTRGAAALLRLAIQKLCNNLVKGKGDLNSKIGKLVETGLNKKVQQALDVVRVIGNEAVHPGQIDIKDDQEIAQQLFKLVNIIAQQMITEPANVDAIFKSLPEDKKQQVVIRDKKKIKNE